MTSASDASKPLWKSLLNPAHPDGQYFWFGCALLAIFLRGLWIDVMDVDAAQYASISQEMLQNGSWLEVMHRGADYLDKPPLPFWLSAFSFKIFGVSNWSYKLPSLLAAFAGIWAVFRFTRLFYSFKTARQAAFMLASALGIMVICNDVRTDTLLLGFTACSIWQLAEYLEFARWRNLVAGFVLVGLAMLAKGPIGVVMPAFATGTHLLLSGRSKDFFKWQWLVGLAIVAVVLTPMCWGLWQQFDLHPEKVVNGRKGVSGLYFYFWEQSFGRITGENRWHNDASVLYFTHVYLWAFLPWCLLLPGAWWRATRNAFRRMAAVESYSLGAFTLTFIALSLSQYKLPHYIFITLPWAAVLTAVHLNRSDRPGVRNIHWALLYLASFLAMAIAFAVLYYVFPTKHSSIWGISIMLAGVFLLAIYNHIAPADSDELVKRGLLAAILAGFVLNFYFYPSLLPYQPTHEIARTARALGIAPGQLASFHRQHHSLDFYNGQYLRDYKDVADVHRRAQQPEPFWLFADTAGKEELETNHIPVRVEKSFGSFPVSLLKGSFLNPETRPGTLDSVYLLRVLPMQ